MQSLPITDMNPLLSMTPMLQGGIAGGGGALHPSMHANFPLRKHLYTDVLSNLRQVMIDRMVKPEEVRGVSTAFPAYGHFLKHTQPSGAHRGK